MIMNRKSLIRARYHAAQLLDSIAGSFDLSHGQVRRALDATWELYLDAVDACDAGADGVAHFVAGFKDILANLEHLDAPEPQPVAQAA